MKRSLLLLLLSFSLLIPAVLSAQEFWVSANEGIAGATVISLDIDAAGKIYATTAAGIYRSDDDGISWHQLPLRLGYSVLSAAVGRNGKLYATTSDSLYWSSDRGESWMARTLGLPELDRSTLLGVDSVGRLYADRRDIVRSSDEGATWDTIIPRSRLQGSFHGTSFAVSTLMLVSSSESILVSSDQGESWDPVAGPAEAGGRYYAAEVLPGGVLLVATPRGLYRSDDRAASWLRVDTFSVAKLRAGVDGRVYQIFGNPPGYITSPLPPSGLRVSTDRGLSWGSVRNRPLADILADRAGHLLAVVSGGLERSMDGGSTWDAENRGLTNLQITGLVSGPYGMLAAVVSRRLGMSTDDGMTWEYPGTDRLSGSPVLGFLPSGNLLIGPDGLYNDTGRIDRSDTHGRSWETVISGLTGTPHAIVRTAAGEIFIGTGQDGGFGTGQGSIYRSMDSGASWKRIWLDKPIRYIAVKNTGEIFAISYWYTDSGPIFAGGALHRSTDGGTTWKTLNDSLNASAIVIDRNGVIYTDFDRTDNYYHVDTNEHYILRSSDNGETWSSSRLELGDHGMIMTLAVDSAGAIYAGTSDRGVFRSIDEGRTWSPLNDGLPSLRISGITVSQTGIVTVGTEENGIYRSRVAQVARVATEPAPSATIYPNPATGIATLGFEMKTGGNVTIELYSIEGEHVATVLNEYRGAGPNQIRFDVSGLVDGAYIYRIRSGDSERSGRVMVISSRR